MNIRKYAMMLLILLSLVIFTFVTLIIFTNLSYLDSIRLGTIVSIVIIVIGTYIYMETRLMELELKIYR